MLPRADLSIGAIARTEAVRGLEGIGDPRQEAFQRSMASLMGQSLTGKVVSRLTDGSYLVALAGATARMLLPSGTQPGAQLPMTLVALHPRPTFQIAPQGAPASFTHAEAATTGRPPLPASSLAVPPDLAQARAAAVASGAALPPELAQARPAALPGGAPLPPGTDVDADPRATGLQPGSQAGAQAAAASAGTAAVPGRAAAPALAPPPAAPSVQTTLSPTAQVLSNVLSLAMSGPATPHAIVAPAPLAPVPGAPPAQLAAALRESVGKSGLFYESHVAEWAAGARTLAELATEPQMQRAGALPGPALEESSMAQLISLQLQTQEQARVVWQGQPWPGQDMHWEVQRDEHEGEGSPDGEAPEAGWRSSLHLRFPLLGEIGARLYMTGDQVHLQIDAGERVGELLRQRSGELSSAMEAAGIALSSFNIRSGEEDA